MAKQKRAKPAAARETKPVSRLPARPRASAPRHGLMLADGKLSVRGYVVLNLMFDAFCVLQLFFISFTLHETKGLYFFFGLLMVGFFVVSIYDFVYDRLVPAAPEIE